MRETKKRNSQFVVKCYIQQQYPHPLHAEISSKVGSPGPPLQNPVESDGGSSVSFQYSGPRPGPDPHSGPDWTLKAG